MTIRPRATSSRISSGVEVLALGDEFHFGRDDALAGGFELRHGFASKGLRRSRAAKGSLPYAGTTRIRFQGCVLSPASGRGTPSDVS